MAKPKAKSTSAERTSAKKGSRAMVVRSGGLPSATSASAKKRSPNTRSVMLDYWKQPIESAEPIWRYFRVKRFIKMLSSGHRHLAAARQFADRFEGAVAIQANDFPVDPRYAEPDHAERAFAALTRLVRVECWHRADFESDAMWRLYAGLGKGVAIRTTTGRAVSSLRPFRLAPTYGAEDPFFGAVRYVDLTQERLNVGTEERFLYKHRAFEWEKEFRIAISLRVADEFGVNVPENGILVAFDAATLVETVFIGPDLDATEKALVLQACEKAGLSPRVCVTSLLSRPRYC